MSLYAQFNNYILQNIFHTSKKGDYIFITIDEDFIDQFCEYHGIKKSSLCENIIDQFSFDWYYAPSGKPLAEGYLGLIALQVYVAGLMQSDGIYSHDAYNPRLTNFFGIQTGQHLQQLYARFQDEIWQGVKSWAERNGFQTTIPQVGWGPGRYVQYPLSQALMNKRDFNALETLFVKRHLRPWEDISFEDFCGILTPIYSNELTLHFHRLYDKLSETNNTGLLFQQMFNFYMGWRGSDKTIVASNQINAHQVSEEQLRTKLIVNNRLDEVYVDDAQNHRLLTSTFSDKNLVSAVRKFHRPARSDFWLFVKNEDYDDWEEERFAQFDEPFVFVAALANMDTTTLHTLSRFVIEEKSTSLFLVFKAVISKQEHLTGLLSSFFSKGPALVIIEGGLKISRNTYLHKAGPQIILKIPCKAWLNGIQIEPEVGKLNFSCRDLAPGSYALKISGSTAIRFLVSEGYPHSTKATGGWNVGRKPALWRPVEESPDITGLAFRAKNIDGTEYPIRGWIELNLKTSDRAKYLMPGCLVNEALARKKYGIY